MAAFASGMGVYADGFMPLLDQCKEWGYVQHGMDPENRPEDIPVYYRMGVGKVAVVNGKAYQRIASYTNFRRSYTNHVAYMREENGKVFALYDEDSLDPYGYYGAGKEYLLYDFNMKVGESLTLEPRADGEEGIVLKCIETGVTETKHGTRRYLKFDRNASATTQSWMAYEYLVEGIGPVGNCNFAVPYRLMDVPTCSDCESPWSIDFLYQRGVEGDNHDDNEHYQHEMLWTVPAFEVWGVHDPSVWLYPTKESGDASVENITMPSMPDQSIALEKRGNQIVITSINNELTEVVLYDMLGRALARYAPASHEFKLDLEGLDTRIIVVRAVTSTGSRSFKIDNP